MSRVWAITTYYNPGGYVSRLKNFKEFRSRLPVPLVAVEVANAAFDLTKTDADILIQLRSDTVLWHKESLLNIALNHLPRDAKAVAWVDCDVVFPSEDLASQILESLQSSKLIQLFKYMYDVFPSDDFADRGEILKRKPSGRGIAFLWVEKQVESHDFLPRYTSDMRKGLFGLAWAASVDLMRSCRFYDAMIIGSGDRALACGALGKFDYAAEATCMNAVRRQHYQRWASKFHEFVQSEVGYIDQPLFHLWHGEIANRKYVERHRELARLGFEPDKHLEQDWQGLWRWLPGSEEIQMFARAYFDERREDQTAPL